MNKLPLFIGVLSSLLVTSCTAMLVEGQPQPAERRTTVVVRPAPTPPPAPVQVYAPNQFYNDLSPYGRWIEVGRYGLVWQPHRVSSSWRPYTYGYWAYTDYGWMFQSEEPYGWAVYHYGRWNHDSRYGWIWVPGDEWAPAWVAWREGGDYIGWAPLPSSARWNTNGRFYYDDDYDDDDDYDHDDYDFNISPSYWCFVKYHHFCNRNIRTYVQRPTFNVTIIQNSRNITNYTIINNYVVNRSFRADQVERYTNRKVVHYNVRDVSSRSDVGRYSANSRELPVYRPRSGGSGSRYENSGRTTSTSPATRPNTSYPSRNNGNRDSQSVPSNRTPENGNTNTSYPVRGRGEASQNQTQQPTRPTVNTRNEGSSQQGSRQESTRNGSTTNRQNSTSTPTRVSRTNEYTQPQPSTRDTKATQQRSQRYNGEANQSDNSNRSRQRMEQGKADEQRPATVRQQKSQMQKVESGTTPANSRRNTRQPSEANHSQSEQKQENATPASRGRR